MKSKMINIIFFISENVTPSSNRIKSRLFLDEDDVFKSLDKKQQQSLNYDSRMTLGPLG